MLQITLFWNTFVFDFQCYLHNISRLKSYHRGLVCCISTDQWEYSISEVRNCELIKMRKAKIFSQSEIFIIRSQNLWVNQIEKSENILSIRNASCCFQSEKEEESFNEKWVKTFNSKLGEKFFLNDSGGFFYS